MTKEFTNQAASLTRNNSRMPPDGIKVCFAYSDNVNAICATRPATVLIIDAINSAHY